MDDDVIEHTLYINREVKLYRIPPRSASVGHKSGDWRVADNIFSGRLRIIAKGSDGEIRLEDAATGELFALCPFTPATQAVAIEPTVDSSRYFVLRIEDPATKRHAFLGLGFNERGEAFDFNAALADHAKQCQRESIVSQAAAAAPLPGSSSSSTGQLAPGLPAAAAAGPSLAMQQDPAFAALYKDPGNLSLKEGQTIRIDVHRSSAKAGGFLSRAAGGSGGFGAAAAADGSSKGLLPPPIQPPPPGGQHTSARGLLSPPAATPTESQQPAAPPAAVTVAASEENWATFD